MNAHDMSPKEVEEAIAKGATFTCLGLQGGQQVIKRVVAYTGEEDLYLILNDYVDSPYKHPLVAEGVGHLFQLMQMIGPLEKWELKEPEKAGQAEHNKEGDQDTNSESGS